jgi:hypothetical protein
MTSLLQPFQKMMSVYDALLNVQKSGIVQVCDATMLNSSTMPVTIKTYRVNGFILLQGFF